VRVDAHFQTSEYGGIEIFANTHSSSKLRLLCVYSLAYEWHDGNILDLSAEYSDLMDTCPEGLELLKAVFNFWQSMSTNLHLKRFNMSARISTRNSDPVCSMPMIPKNIVLRRRLRRRCEISG
jgi:hypothetical protein